MVILRVAPVVIVGAAATGAAAVTTTGAARLAAAPASMERRETALSIMIHSRQGIRGVVGLDSDLDVNGGAGFGFAFGFWVVSGRCLAGAGTSAGPDWLHD